MRAAIVLLLLGCACAAPRDRTFIDMDLTQTHREKDPVLPKLGSVDLTQSDLQMSQGSQDGVQQSQTNRQNRKRIVLAAPTPCDRRAGACRSDVYEFVLWDEDSRANR